MTELVAEGKFIVSFTARGPFLTSHKTGDIVIGLQRLVNRTASSTFLLQALELLRICSGCGCVGGWGWGAPLLFLFREEPQQERRRLTARPLSPFVCFIASDVLTF